MKKIPFKRVRLIFILLVFFILAVLPSQAQEEVLNKDCSINWQVFNRDWKKYSDIDERLSFDELSLSTRSWETQQYYSTQETLVDLKLQMYFLKRDMEIDRQMRLELRAYKDSLVKNIKVNLLKSFWRLAYITYDTIKTGKGLGSSYSKLFTSSEVIPKLGASLKVLKGLTPKQSQMAINTKNTTGKIKSISVNGALEAVESLADPIDTGMAVYNETVKQIFPQADLSEEEIKILQDQHLNNRMVTQVLEESYRMNKERLKQVKELEEKVKKLEQELVRWEAEEKKRVADILIDNCKKNLRKVAKKAEPVEDEEIIQYGELECPQAPPGFSFLPLEGESGWHLDEEYVLSFFGIEPDSTCVYELRNVAPEFPYFVTDRIQANLFIWQFLSVNEAKEEYLNLISKGKSEMGSEGQILDDTENRIVIDNIERMEETFFEGSIDKNYTYERSLYTLMGVLLYKNYVLIIHIGADIPVSVETKAISASKSALNELEKNTKLLLSD